MTLQKHRVRVYIEKMSYAYDILVRTAEKGVHYGAALADGLSAVFSLP
jgi:hypothetical protein